MFIAKIIEDKRYYQLRNIAWFLMLLFTGAVLAAILIALFFPNVFLVDDWILPEIGIMAPFLIGGIIMFIAHKKYFGKRKILCDEESIIIENGKPEEIPINDISRIIIGGPIRISQEGDVKKVDDMIHFPDKQYLVLIKKDKILKYDFVIDSYFMATQLRKLLKTWKEHHVNVIIEEDPRLWKMVE